MLFIWTECTCILQSRTNNRVLLVFAIFGLCVFVLCYQLRSQTTLFHDYSNLFTMLTDVWACTAVADCHRPGLGFELRAQNCWTWRTKMVRILVVSLNWHGIQRIIDSMNYDLLLSLSDCQWYHDMSARREQKGSYIQGTYSSRFCVPLFSIPLLCTVPYCMC